MPPISTRRWPSFGSRPVVSVSRTISRISLRSAGPAGNGAQDPTDPALGVAKAKARFDEKMRAPALLRIGHLLCQYCLKLLLRHARPSEHAPPLHRFWRGNEGNRIGFRLAASLEQQRNVENDDRRLGMSCEEPVAFFAHQRMHDALEGAQARFVFEQHFREPRAIDRPIFGSAGEGRLDQRGGAAAVEGVHDGVGIVNRHAFGTEHRRSRRLDHADRAGEAECEHAAVEPRRLPCRRKKASRGMSGRPRMVEWSASICSNSWMPRPSTWYAPTLAISAGPAA